MNQRDHLRRLARVHYQADSIVHWVINMLDRRQGWLTSTFYYRFRELLTHTMFRYGLSCPIYCLMPDHFHMVWMGLCDGSDQLNAMKHFRCSTNESLTRIGFELQDQAFDHVLRNDERRMKRFISFANTSPETPSEPDWLDRTNSRHTVTLAVWYRATHHCVHSKWTTGPNSTSLFRSCGNEGSCVHVAHDCG